MDFSTNNTIFFQSHFYSLDRQKCHIWLHLYHTAVGRLFWLHSTQSLATKDRTLQEGLEVDPKFTLLTVQTVFLFLKGKY
jgi:hypothetical protein